MATLAEIANQVNNTLTQIETNTKDTADVVALVKGDTADIKARLDTLIATNAAGFQFLGEGLYTMQELQREANAHLATLVGQGTAALCWLSILAELSCRHLRAEEEESRVHEQLLAALRTLEGVAELVHAREFVQYSAHQQLAAQVAACCPTPTPYPEPCYQRCDEPEIRRHDPRGQGWTPDFTPLDGNPTGGPR